MHKRSYKQVKADRGETRFRGSIYVDIWVSNTTEAKYDEETGDEIPESVQPRDLEEMRAEVRAILESIAEEISNKTGNAYVGGVAKHDIHNFPNTLDAEI